MSLQEEIYSLFYSSCFDEGGYNEFTQSDAQKMVNKVLDAAVEAADSKRHKLSKQLSPDDRDNIFFNAGVDTSIKAINKLRESNES